MAKRSRSTGKRKKAEVKAKKAQVKVKKAEVKKATKAEIPKPPAPPESPRPAEIPEEVEIDFRRVPAYRCEGCGQLSRLRPCPVCAALADTRPKEPQDRP